MEVAEATVRLRGFSPHAAARQQGFGGAADDPLIHRGYGDDLRRGPPGYLGDCSEHAPLREVESMRFDKLGGAASDPVGEHRHEVGPELIERYHRLGARTLSGSLVCISCHHNLTPSQRLANRSRHGPQLRI